MGMDCFGVYFSAFLRGNRALAFEVMTRVSSYSIYQCPDCKCEHILPNYVSISVTEAVDAYVPDEDLRMCFGCGAVKPFNQFTYVSTKQKPRPDHTSSCVKLIKRIFGIRRSDVEPHPARVYPYLNQKTPNRYAES